MLEWCLQDQPDDRILPGIDPRAISPMGSGADGAGRINEYLHAKGRLRVKTNRQWKHSTLLVAAWGVTLLAVPGVGQGAEAAAHPELSEQEQLIDCAQCHLEATPEVVKEWYDSVHGIAMIKCYQCHGTFDSFTVSPPRDNCGICHADKLENHAAEQGKAADTPCWECHVPHSFKAKK